MGAVFSVGWERAVQMKGPDPKGLKRSINRVWIYPPVDDAETIIRQANYEKTWRIDEVSA